MKSSFNNDLRWSKYNLLFKSKTGKHLIYNALSNRFAEVTEECYKKMLLYDKYPDNLDFIDNIGLYTQLSLAKILVTDNDEEDFITQRKFLWNAINYDNTSLNLTIAPTLSCNFKCPYCYQSDNCRSNAPMNDLTEDKLIKFIKSFGNLKYLVLFWFGGEPLLEFDRIKSITEKIAQLGIPYKASLITNGYLLTDDVIKVLDELKIKSIQITIDGPQKTHDTRRILLNNGKTYDVILSNIENLLKNSNIRCNIRVNVDKSNAEEFVQVYKVLTEKFNNKNLYIYPGIVSDSPTTNPHVDCQFNRKDIVDFYINLRQKYNIHYDNSFYPSNNNFGCIATSKNSFVIGPQGEVYKCWNDIGLPNMVVGNVANNEWNKDLIAKYIEGVSIFNDSNCIKCFYFPICDGGCSNKRLRKKYFNEDLDTCSTFKGHIKEFLEMYYDDSKCLKEPSP